jgi:sugar lactone lactonase YvrE
MKVFITGASGTLGESIGNTLVSRGWGVSGCDARPSASARFPITLIDLAPGPDLAPLLAGCDAVIHLANHADFGRAPAARILAENESINACVFSAALSAGVQTFVFSSSVQLINGRERYTHTPRPFSPAYLPLDGQAPPRIGEGNTYARSKLSAETLLRSFAAQYPDRGFISLRFPFVVEPAGVDRALSRSIALSTGHEAFAFLPLEETGPLLDRILRARLTGYRCYLPAACENLLFLPPRRAIAKHFPHTPLRRPLDSIDALIDTTGLTLETGWRPQPVTWLAGPTGWRRRALLLAQDLAGRRWPGLCRRLRAAATSLRRPFAPRIHVLGTAQLVSPARAALGESPLWHPAQHRLLWVDIPAATLHRFDPVTGSDEILPLPEPASAVACDSSGRTLVALQESVHRIDFSPTALTPAFSHRIDGPPNRLNDGKFDAQGRLWIGSMHVDGLHRTGSLFCVHPDGRVERKLTGVACSNGLAWSLDRKTFYYIDSGDRRIDAFEFDPASGNISRRRTLLAIPPSLGVPDGMCTDVEDKLWVALHGGGRVLRIDPANARILGAVKVPARDVTSCAFGGPQLDTLYITTARASLGPAQLARQPDAGGLFAFQPGVHGAPSA